MLAFYTGLGCSVERTIDEIGLHQLRAGDSIIDILEVDDATTTSRLDHFALRVDPFDPDEITTLLKTLGASPGTLREGLYGADGFGPSIYVEDPDTNTVEIKGPPTAPPL